MSRSQLAAVAATLVTTLVAVLVLTTREPEGPGAPEAVASAALGASPQSESNAVDGGQEVAESGTEDTTAGGPADRTLQEGPDPRNIRVTIETLTTALDNVVGLKSPPDGTGRLFIVEKAGRIRIWENGELAEQPFLDITERVETSNGDNDERGLLGLAFHPNWAENHEFFVNYTGRGQRGLADITGRFQVGADGMGDPDSEELVISYDDPAGNHNGGDLAFGPDGYLYIASGDGGGANDGFGNGQDKSALLAKILRLDVDGEHPYTVPADNPFVGQPNAAPEAWAWGFRNPWRFSFDRATGDLYVADVGQGSIEEVDFAAAGGAGGENYGWSIMEGSQCFGGGNCDRRGLVLPVAEYSHSEGCSITGGYVYRGGRYPTAAGLYLYSDWCSRTIWGLSRDDAGRWRDARVGSASFGVASFGEGADGEMYIMGLGNLGRIAFDVPTAEPSVTPSATEPTPTQDSPATPVTPETATPPARWPTATITPTPPPPPAHLPLLRND